MATQWDDDRIEAQVEARTDDGRPGQKTLTNGQGYVIRLWDTGQADGRLDQRLLLFDSETTYGTGGIFGDEAEAVEYRDRRLQAQLVGARSKEALTAERRDQLPKLGTECIQAAATAKREAKDANARAKAATDRHDALTEEALAPVVIIECPPRGSGWTVRAALCETEGHDGEPRTLAEVVPDGAKKPRRTRTSRSKAKADPLPDAIEASFGTMHDDGKPDKVPDYCGIPFGVGATVRRAEEGADPAEGEVLAITRPDTNGQWYVEVEFPDGPVEAYSIEFERIRDEDGEDHWGDDGPEATA